MKNPIVLFACLMTAGAACSSGSGPIEADRLPQQARTFIEKHFPDAKIAAVQEESYLFNKEYDVIFTNGTRVEFDKSGAWKEIDCREGSVPEAAVPAAMRKFIDANFDSREIVQIERGKRGYDVELSDGTELDFDERFSLIEVGD